MAENTEMNTKAKDIAALFRSAVEAENKAMLGETSTFAEQDFFITARKLLLAGGP